eukprot:4532898-Alexandrium_andersonii.AAC.1
MSASLVGSEMCIRDRGDSCPFSHGPTALAQARQARQNNAAAAALPPAQEAAPPAAAKAKGKAGQDG